MEAFDSMPENATDFNAEEFTQEESKKKKSVDEPEEEEQDDFENTLEILKIKHKIIRYSQSFGKYLEIFTSRLGMMDDLDLPQLKKLLMEIEIAVRARTSGNMCRTYYMNAMQVAEKVAPFIGMNLNGLFAIMNQNEQINECLEELSIKYDVMHHVNPEIRLGFITLNTVLALNSQNKKINKVAEILDQAVKAEHIEDYKDL